MAQRPQAPLPLIVSPVTACHHLLTVNDDKLLQGLPGESAPRLAAVGVPARAPHPHILGQEQREMGGRVTFRKGCSGWRDGPVVQSTLLEDLSSIPNPRCEVAQRFLKAAERGQSDFSDLNEYTHSHAHTHNLK